uniref:Uncharacterized protein n=1 Tax=Oryza nivara TaxID=4536 RepID=A0A0E0IR21_ORYNI
MALFEQEAATANVGAGAEGRREQPSSRRGAAPRILFWSVNKHKSDSINLLTHQLMDATVGDKETRRVIGRIYYFFVGSATSCNQQTYKWLRLLGAPHHQVQNQVSHVHVIDSNDALFAC